MNRYYYIITLVTILTTVACEKSHIIDKNSGNLYGGVVGYSTSVVQPTKAVESTITQLQQNGFNIATFVKESDDDYAPYYTDIVKYSDPNWGSGVNRYWPQPDTRTLDMFAHSPITADKDFVVVRNPTDRSQYSLRYTCPSDVDEQIDLLVATLTDQSYYNHSVKEDQTNTEAVGIEFNHALSAIKFTVKFKDEKNIELNKIRIHYIGIEKERTYNFATQTWDEPDTKSYFLGSETDASIVINETKASISGEVFFDEINNQLMIIPQPISEGDSENADPNYIAIQVAYKIVSGTGTAPATSVETGWMPLPAPKVDKDGNAISTSEYKKGEAYTYNILINGTEIKLDDVDITDQDPPLNAFGNIDLGLIETSMTPSEIGYTETTETTPQYYYTTALRVKKLLLDGVRDFVVVGSMGATQADHLGDGKLGYYGAESSAFSIGARLAEAESRDSYLFSVDLRGTFDYPEFQYANTDANSEITPATDCSDMDPTDPIMIAGLFSKVERLNEVILPSGIMAIGHHTFEGCSALKKIDIVEVKHIEAGGFQNSSALEIVENGALTRIHNNAFKNCETLTTIDLTNVKEVGDFGFVNCHKLTSLNLTNLSKVGASAFDNCYDLTLSEDMTSKVIKLTEVKKYAFSNCSKLGEFGAKLDLTEAIYVDEHAFNDCTKITFSAGNLDKLETIGDYAFTDCSLIGKSVKEFSMPKIETIGEYAFKGCTHLNIVEGLENLTEITTSAFQECTSLTGYSSTASESEKVLSLPLVTSVGYGGFKETALTSVSFLNESGESGESGELTTIGDNAFDECENLTTISGLDKVISVGEYAFSSCTKLTTIELPIATSVGNSAFYGCTSLVMLSVPKADFTIDVWRFSKNTTLKTVDLASITSIGDGVFFGCTALETADLSSVESVGENAFQNCSSLTALDLPLATWVGASALSGCSSLETLYLPIAEGSFGGWCYFCATDTDGNTISNTSLESVNLSSITTLSDGTFSDCLSLQSLILTDYPGSANGAIGGEEGNSIGSWGEGSGYFFENFANLIHIDLASVETVKGGAFYNQDKIEAIDLRSATSVDGNAFNGCISLKRLNLSSLVLDMEYGVDGIRHDNNIGSYAFSGITDGQCEIWLPSEQAVTAVGKVWQGVAWAEIHSVDSEGNCETLFVLKSKN